MFTGLKRSGPGVKPLPGLVLPAGISPPSSPSKGPPPGAQIHPPPARTPSITQPPAAPQSSPAVVAPAPSAPNQPYRAIAKQAPPIIPRSASPVSQPPTIPLPTPSTAAPPSRPPRTPNLSGNEEWLQQDAAELINHPNSPLWDWIRQTIETDVKCSVQRQLQNKGVQDLVRG